MLRLVQNLTKKSQRNELCFVSGQRGVFPNFFIIIIFL